MVKVFASPNAAVVNMARDILVQHEIGCTIRNERVAGAAGEVPWTEVWPELWVADERQADAARALLEPFEGDLDPLRAPPSWTCAVCGESVEGQFTDCWACGAERPG